ncbi:MAG: hypothetical protein MUE60_16265 [Candidatus Eisenbacteria bacterium]|nr:hypothetical protein [Candidatus Eisenbacteria bacterium]
MKTAWTVACVAGVAGVIAGVSHADDLGTRKRVSYPDPVPEEILAGRIACDAGGGLYVPIEVHCDRVVFRDSTSTVVASLPRGKGSNVNLSPQGDYASIVTLDPAPDKEALGTCVAAMYDRRGTVLWSITRSVELDGALPWPRPFGTDGASLDLSEGLQAAIVRDSHGSIIRTMELIPQAMHDDESGAAIAFSEDGDCLAVLANADAPIAYGAPGPGGAGNPGPAHKGWPQLALLDRTGHELWRRPLEELGIGLKVDVSKSGALVIAGCASLDEQRGIVDSGIYVFARDGSLIGKYAIHTPGGIWSPQFAVSADEQRIALANLGRVMVLDSRTGNVVWDQPLSSSSTAEGIQAIEDVKFLGQGYSLAVARTTQVKHDAYRRIDLIFVDESGRVVREADSCGTMHLRGDVVVTATPSGDRAGVLTAQGLVVVER